MKWTILLAAILFGNASNVLSKELRSSHYVISSGSVGGNYAKAGDLICTILNEKYTSLRFSNVNSSGSIENLANLEQDFSDFALVQRNLLLKNIYHESRGIKNIEVIAPIYQEKLLIYHKKQPHQTEDIEELTRLINDGTYRNIGFTDPEGYAYVIFIRICKLLNIPIYNLEFVFDDYDNLAASFNEGQLDLLISFSLEIEELESNENSSSYHFTQDEVDLITSRISNTSPVTLENGNYTIGSYTFLVGITSKIEEIENLKPISLCKTITEGIKKKDTFVANKIKATLNDFSKPEFQNYLKGLPVNAAYSESIDYDIITFANWRYILLTIVLMIILFIILPSRLGNQEKIRSFWIRYNHIIFGILLLAFFYVLSIEILIWAEQELYVQLKLKSQILNMSRSDLHLWIFVSTMINDNNGIFPLSTIGKLMLSTAFYTTWIGGICILAAEYFKKQSFKKRKEGMKQITFKDHIVISGWNHSSSQFIIDFLKATNEYTSHSKKLVCIVPDPKEVMNNSDEITLLHDVKKIEFVAGDIKEEEALERSNIQYASAVVLFAENNDESADEKTLLRALSVSRFCRKHSFKYRAEKTKKSSTALYDTNRFIDSIYIIAEINDDKYKQDLIASDVNEIICSNNYSRNIITQSILNKGVSKVLDEVLTYNSNNEFYTLSMVNPNNKLLVGKTFDELLVLLRKVNIQLIGIRIVYRDKSENEIIDHEVVADLLRADNLDSDIIINPTTENERQRRIDDDDTLIVFCRSEMELNKGIKKLNKLNK